MIQGRRADADEDIIGTELRRGHVFHADHAGIAELMEHGRSHGDSWQWCCRRQRTSAGTRAHGVAGTPRPG